MSTNTADLIAQCAKQLYADGHYELAQEIAALKTAQPVTKEQPIKLYAQTGYRGKLSAAIEAAPRLPDQDKFSDPLVDAIAQPVHQADWGSLTGHAAIESKIAAQPVEPATGCACKWNGELSESRCELHEAWHVAILEWSDRAKAAEAKLAQPAPAAPYQVTDEQAEAVMTRLGLSDCRTAVKIALQHHEARKASASEQNMPVTPTEKMCEVINGGYDNLSAVDKERLMNRAKLVYSALLKVAPTAHPAQKQIAYPDLADCEVIRSHWRCWKESCVAAGACTVQQVQPAQRQSQGAMPTISPQAERALIECRDCFVTYEGSTSDANELARYVLELQAAWPQPVQPATKGDKP